MQPMPPFPSLTCWWRVWMSGLLHRQLRFGAYSLFFFFPSSWLCSPLRFQNSPQSTCEKISYCVETSPSWLPPQDGSRSLNLLSLFSSFIFYPTSFRRDWAAFLGAWCPPPAFRSCLWKLLSIQMIFWWICGGSKWFPHPIPLLSWDCPLFYNC